MPATVGNRKADQFRANPAARLLRQLTGQVRRTLKGCDARAVHDLRVKIRRLNQARVVFKSSFAGKPGRKLRLRLKKMMTLAGAVRDCDITMKLLSKSKSAHAALRSSCESERRNGEKALLKSLGRWEHRHTAFSSDDGASTIAIEETATRVLPPLAQDFFARGRRAANGASPRELHKFRIAAKKFRYTLELFRTVYGPGLNHWLDQIKGIQSRLGRINDYETARGLVTRLASNASSKLAAELKKKEQAEVEEFHGFWTADMARDWKGSPLAELSDPRAWDSHNAQPARGKPAKGNARHHHA